jgi:hypothetical protein
MKQYNIITIQDYPGDGKHQECYINLPFQIRKGEDGYCWMDKKGKEHKYNLYEDGNKVDDRWIIDLTNDASFALEDIFEIKVDKDIEKIIQYCVNIYRKSLEIELERVRNEFSDYIK